MQGWRKVSSADRFKCILSKEPFFPPELDEDACDACKRYLRKDATERVTAAGTFAEMQRHPFFHDFAWASLGSKLVRAPVVAEKERFSMHTPAEPKNLATEPSAWDE